MPDVVKHAWTHRSRARGGTDPVDTNRPFIQFGIQAKTVVAGDHSSSDHVGVPLHDDYSPFGYKTGGFDVSTDGGIILPTQGLFDIQVNARISDTDWQTKNFQLVTYFVLNGTVLDDVLGSQTLFSSVLEHSLAHDGTGLTPTTDRRKNVMQHRVLWLAAGFDPEFLPLSIYPTYYSYTSSESTGWSDFQCTIVNLSDTYGTVI